MNPRIPVRRCAQIVFDRSTQTEIMKISDKEKRSRAYRAIVVYCTITLIPIGIASKFYQGPLQWWINDFFGDILYEAFWIMVGVLIWPRASLAKIASGVFIATCLIEVLQLWQPPFLQAIRATFIGQLFLGTTFVWWDFPHYLAGCVLTWAGLRYLKTKLLSAGEETRP